MRLLRWIAIALLGVVTGVAVVALGARFADGPVGPFPGGALRSGEWVDAAEVDWTFAADVEEIVLESAGRSRTTWILVVDGVGYVPCSLRFPPGKSWHHAALEDPRAVVRIDGRRWRRRLLREDDPARRKRLFDVGVAKYGYPADTPLADIWFFRLDPPG